MRVPDPDPPFRLQFTDRWEQESQLLLGNVERAADMVEGLELLLRENPKAAGTLVPGTADIYVVHIFAPGSAQEFTVFYRVQGRGTVTLESLYPVSPEELEELG